jgi:hypothetical protein
MGLLDDIQDFASATHEGVRSVDAREPLTT